MKLSTEEQAGVVLDQIGAHQQAITDLGADPRAGADAIAERLEAVVTFLYSAGFERAAIKEQLLEPIQEWLIYTIAPRWLKAEDPAQDDSHYLFERLRSLLSELGVND
ncbi:hypothetical protein [Rathayibacter sp. AY1F6]|uniref:hypothetical protein n=1 Tax=Rathayibacter sp. AY1F6 TaxID=2080560 RepID=UPI0011B0EA5D|nr:hypothetical protein [Rathayibacter sp. AY1F6]